MSIKTSINHPAPTKKSRLAATYLLALGLSSSSLVTGVAVTGLMAVSTTSQAASLSDLFGNNSDKSPKFLSVEEAFQVTSSTQPVAKGTQLSINFDITPEHYAYLILRIVYLRRLNSANFSSHKKARYLT